MPTWYSVGCCCCFCHVLVRLVVCLKCPIQVSHKTEIIMACDRKAVDIICNIFILTVSNTVVDSGVSYYSHIVAGIALIF